MASILNYTIIREPEDRLAETRISIGTAPMRGGMYIVFRGDPRRVVEVLRDALDVASRDILTEKYQDRRNRPQG